MDLHAAPLAPLREELARVVAESSLSEQARARGVSRGALRGLLAGAAPTRRTRERLLLWYGERVLQRRRVESAREEALRLLLQDLSPEAAERARARILEVLDEAWTPLVLQTGELLAQLNAELARRGVPGPLRFGDGVLRYWRSQGHDGPWDELLALEGERARSYVEVAGRVIRWARARFALAPGR